MKNTSTTLELPEGSKATIQGKVIDGKNYLVVEVEQESEGENTFEIARKMLDKKRAEIEAEAPEWKKFKMGDVLVSLWGNVLIFGRYISSDKSVFTSICNNGAFSPTCVWSSEYCTHATEQQKAEFFKWLEKEKGLEWDGEKLVEVPKEGDMAIFWDVNPRDAIISVCKRLDDNGRYVDHLAMYWDNAIKWDGTKEQYERVLRGEL